MLDARKSSCEFGRVSVKKYINNVFYRNDELSKQKLSGCGDELCARDYLLIPGGTGVLPGTEASVSSKDKKKLETRDRYSYTNDCVITMMFEKGDC